MFVLRLGLCCLFVKEPIRFRTTTATSLKTVPRELQLNRLSEICAHNSHTLFMALETVRRLGISAFRIMSPLFPRMTHPDVGYRLADLPEGVAIGGKLE